MDNEKKEQVEKETLTIVLEEFSQEQKATGQTISDLVTAVNGLSGRFEEFKKELDNPKSVSVTTDTQPILTMLQKSIADIKSIIDIQPKSIVRKFQVLLFPEQDAKLFYKIVFGRWLMLLAVMLLLTNLYKWGIHYSDNQKEIKIEHLRNERIRKAWVYMYQNQGRSVKKLMDEAYADCEQKNK